MDERPNLPQHIVRVVPAHVEVAVSMTQDEFTEIERAAHWHGMPVDRYLVAEALGRTPRGC